MLQGLPVFLRHRISLRILTKIRERSAKDTRKIRERCKPNEPPALQAMGDDTASAIFFGARGLSHLPSMLCALTGSVLELRVWVKSSFESSGLGLCLKHASAKARDSVREKTLDFHAEVILL